MCAAQAFYFKVADQAWEFEQIHRMNYRTFVEEIPQHERNPNGALVDKFHDENAYLICTDGEQLYGMLAMRDKRPFSLDSKLENLDSLIPEVQHPCEVRLLAIEHKRRHGRVIQGLFQALSEYSAAHDIDMLLISGTVRQAKLYQNLGFVPFGPQVGSADAPYQPMYLAGETISRLRNNRRFLSREENPAPPKQVINLLPGPVTLKAAVRAAHGGLPISHRSEKFVTDYNHARQILCEMVQAESVAVMMGSGTLANDAIGAQIAARGGRGLILVNGEFGRRIKGHADAAGLEYDTLEAEEGQAFEMVLLDQALQSGARWVWAVHCETSTGVLNDIEAIGTRCTEYGVPLYLDCISSIGSVPVDLGKVEMASAVSGKAIGAHAGLAMVFMNKAPSAQVGRIPGYLDLGKYLSVIPPFTLSSNLVYGLLAALQGSSWSARFTAIAQAGGQLRRRLEQSGLVVLAEESIASPAVLTIPLPGDIDSRAFGGALKRRGILLSYESAYLLERNWVQICIMYEMSLQECERAAQQIDEVLVLVAGTADVLDLDARSVSV